MIEKLKELEVGETEISMILGGRKLTLPYGLTYDELLLETFYYKAGLTMSQQVLEDKLRDQENRHERTFASFKRTYNAEIHELRRKLNKSFNEKRKLEKRVHEWKLKRDALKRELKNAQKV